MRNKHIRLGKVQLQIMQVLWSRKQATAKEITEDLNKTEAIAHSTVQTLLRKLEAKGAVQHEALDRTFVFKPSCEQNQTVLSTTRDFLDRVFQGSAFKLVSHLIDNGSMSNEEIAALRKLISERSEVVRHD